MASHEQHELYDGSQQVDMKLSTFTYDHRGRLLCETTSVNGGASATVSYGYDELGRLVSKTYGNGANAVTETFNYNIQGWLTSQNSELFDMELKYYNPRSGIVPSYTGNITEWVWRQDGNQQNSYGFSYDNLSRLTGYDHLAEVAPTNSFTERGIIYDRNGNIQYLNRYGDMPTLSESYQYLYDGNQLKRVNMLYMGQYISGAGAEYLYDANGNMTFDGQNHRQLEYNFLNLLLKVEGMNASATYKWLADGTKASVTDNLGYGLEYLGSFVYQKTPTDTSLESVAFGAGRFVANSIGSLTAQYQIVDHLGSVRVVFTSPTNVVAQNDYYAFGLRHSNPNLANSSSNRHLFNGKEWQSTGSVGLLDYGARPYDPKTGRWINVDLLAEKKPWLTPYNFCSNSPVNRTDLTGMLDDWYEFDINGNYMGKTEASGTHKIRLHIGQSLEYGNIRNHYRFINFADPQNDAASIDNGIINKLVFVGEMDIISMLTRQGAFEAGVGKFINQSSGGRDFDYSISVLPNIYPMNASIKQIQSERYSNALFLPEGDNTVHNQMNFGNYLWGATGYTVGLGGFVLRTGAHFNSLFGRNNGYSMRFDSEDDQRSISLGIEHARIHNYRDRRK